MEAQHILAHTPQKENRWPVFHEITNSCCATDKNLQFICIITPPPITTYSSFKFLTWEVDEAVAHDILRM
jgi:hypothetical protein